MEKKELFEAKAKAFDLIVQRERIREQERQLSQTIIKQMQIIQEIEKGEKNGITKKGR